MDATTRDPAPTPRGSGFCMEGPGFYVWDEDPDEVRRAAAELARSSRVSGRACRVLALARSREESRRVRDAPRARYPADE